MNNPLLQDILIFIEQAPAGITEHALHCALSEHETFTSLGTSGHLALFRKHFLVMNALYQLQQKLWKESRRVLTISPLHIQLYNTTGNGTTDLPSEGETCADYYLDWNNYQQTRESDVESLLDSFWQRYQQQDARHKAMHTLELGANASQSEIERRYRRLAAIHHPDKGGDKETFISIRSAYEQLR